MSNHFYLYLLSAVVAIYAVRALPLTLIRRDIKSPFIRSFLHYVPYVTLAVMTFPAILSATGSTASAVVGFLAAIIAAYLNGNLFRVAIIACVAVYLAEFFV